MAHRGVQTVRQNIPEIRIQAETAGHTLNLFVRRFRTGEAHILRDAAMIEIRNFQSRPDILTPCAKIDLPEVDPIDPNQASLRLIEPEKGLHKRSFTGATWANDRDKLAWFNLERYLAQSRLSFRIESKGNAVKFNLTRETM